MDITVPNTWSFPVPLTISVKFYPSQLKPLFNTILFSILPYATTSIRYQTTCKAKPIKCIIKLNTDHNILWVKPATHQKAVLRTVSLSKLDNTSTTTLSSIQSILDSLQNGRCFFVFTTVLVHTTSPKISTKNPLLYSSLSPPYFTLTCSQNHPYNTPRYLSGFACPFFAYNLRNNLHQISFSTSAVESIQLCQRTRKLGSLVTLF